MKSTDAAPPYETLEIGTPSDYTNDVYRFYFEVGEHNGLAEKVIKNYLGEENFSCVLELEPGYEIELPIQCVPDLTKELVTEGVGVYQIVRYEKTKNAWL
jgi:hypothetical protein